MPHNDSKLSYEACGTNQRKLMVWEIGVEGDKFNPHRWNDACRVAGCVPLTRDEFIAYSRVDKQTIDRVQVLLSFENMERAPKT